MVGITRSVEPIDRLLGQATPERLVVGIEREEGAQPRMGEAVREDGEAAVPALLDDEGQDGFLLEQPAVEGQP